MYDSRGDRLLMQLERTAREQRWYLQYLVRAFDGSYEHGFIASIRRDSVRTGTFPIPPTCSIETISRDLAKHTQLPNHVSKQRDRGGSTGRGSGRDRLVPDPGMLLRTRRHQRALSRSFMTRRYRNGAFARTAAWRGHNASSR